jgi:hypothetical protein
MALPRPTAASTSRPAERFDTVPWYVHRSNTLALLTYAVLTVLLTWPQAVALNSVPAHQDPLFSIWRLGWIAHALSTVPSELFNGNVYFPARGTLLYSDTTLLQGLLAWPLVGLGVPLPAVYNALVLASFVASAWFMYLLVRELSGSSAGAFLGGVIFAFAPFRFDHYIHLELLWGFWTPLTLWALHRAVDRASVRYGVLAGVFALIQLLSCGYYGVFLSTALPIVVAGLLLSARHRTLRRWRGLMFGGAIAAVGGYLYATPYREIAAVVGRRSLGYVGAYSPKAHAFIAAPEGNWLYGGTAHPWGSNEGHLFVGILPFILAVVALFAVRRVWVGVYAVLLTGAVLVCLGTNAPLYEHLYRWWPGYNGLRVPTRAGLFVVLGVAALAGGGLAAVLRWVRSPRRRATVFAVAVGVVVLEYVNAVPSLRPLEHRQAHVFTWLAAQKDAVVLHQPTPRPNELPGDEPYYQWLSTFHWRPLVNGYSGHYPRPYIELLRRLQTFPDRPSLEVLRARSVRFVIIHDRRYRPREFERLINTMAAMPDFRPVAQFQSVDGEPLTVMELLPDVVARDVRSPEHRSP